MPVRGLTITMVANYLLNGMIMPVANFRWVDVFFNRPWVTPATRPKANPKIGTLPMTMKVFFSFFSRTVDRGSRK